MAKQKKSFINISEAITKIDNWKQGIGHTFTSGTVVEKGTEIGVIMYPSADYEKYQIKWYKGPNPWDYTESECFSRELIKSNKSNPMKYKNSDRYPGPSSKEIDRLNEIFAKTQKVMSPKDIDKHMEILEEEFKNKTNKDFDNDECVIDKEIEDEDSDDSATIIDSVDLKRKKLIEEE